MAVRLKDMRIGSKVIVRGNFGTGAPHTGIVDEIETDIKNGYPGIGYKIPGIAGGNWAYLSQVERVVKY